MPYDPGTQFTITSGFGSRGLTNHPGVDFGAPNGTPIPAAADGVVWYSGFNSSYGNTVILQHEGHDGSVFYTLYAHMNGNEMRGVGEEVSAGQTIGQVGNTGAVFGPTGNHLHFEVITGVDPARGSGGQLGLTPGQGRVDPSTWQDWPDGGVYNPNPGQRGDLGPTTNGDVAAADGGLDPDPALLIAQSGGQPTELIGFGPAEEVDRFYNAFGMFSAQSLKEFDPLNTHPYSELDIDTDATGKPTAVQMKFDGQNGTTAAFASVGQVLGSALGRALAPNDQFGQIAVGTVAGAVGQRLAQAFATSLQTDISKFSLDGAFADFHVSIAGAGAGAVASFLTAELGHALGLDGFKEQLFNATVGTLASGVANKIAADMVSGLTFNGAIGALDWSGAVLGAANNIEPNLAGLLGGYLGRELVPAQTHEGAVGGQLLGAVGSAIGITAALSGALDVVLNFIIPGVGSLIGTIIGTLIGDAVGSQPHPAATDFVAQAGNHYGSGHYQVSASDGGDYGIADPMANHTVSIVNAYFGAVKGVVLDHSIMTWVGYVTDPDFRYVSGAVPFHSYRPSSILTTRCMPRHSICCSTAR
jgi:murein DD-endopeptidase MepM/ murein hydrolase activator NlpD